MFLNNPRAYEQGQICIYGVMSKICLGKKFCVSKFTPVRSKNWRITVSVFLSSLQLTALLLKKIHLCLLCYTLLSYYHLSLPLFLSFPFLVFLASLASLSSLSLSLSSLYLSLSSSPIIYLYLLLIVSLLHSLSAFVSFLFSWLALPHSILLYSTRVIVSMTHIPLKHHHQDLPVPSAASSTRSLALKAAASRAAVSLIPSTV